MTLLTLCCTRQIRALISTAMSKQDFLDLTLTYNLDLQSQPSQGQGRPDIQCMRTPIVDVAMMSMQIVCQASVMVRSRSWKDVKWRHGVMSVMTSCDVTVWRPPWGHMMSCHDTNTVMQNGPTRRWRQLWWRITSKLKGAKPAPN